MNRMKVTEHCPVQIFTDLGKNLYHHYWQVGHRSIAMRDWKRWKLECRAQAGYESLVRFFVLSFARWIMRIHFHVHSGLKCPTVQSQIKCRSSCAAQEQMCPFSKRFPWLIICLLFFTFNYLTSNSSCLQKLLKRCDNILMCIFIMLKPPPFSRSQKILLFIHFYLSGIKICRINVTNEYSTKNKQTSFTFKVTLRDVFPLAVNK